MARKRKEPEAPAEDEKPEVDPGSPIGQQFIPGMAPAKNDRVHPKAVLYVKERDRRIAAGKDEKAAHTDLLEAMLTEGIESYEYGGLTVTVQANRKVKATFSEDQADQE